MTALLALFQLGHRIGFFGQQGPLWVFLGVVCLIVVVAIMYKIIFLGLPALGVTEPWISILYWLFVLFCFLMFIYYAFGGGA